MSVSRRIGWWQLAAAGARTAVIRREWGSSADCTPLHQLVASTQIDLRFLGHLQRFKEKLLEGMRNKVCNRLLAKYSLNLDNLLARQQIYVSKATFLVNGSLMEYLQVQARQYKLSRKHSSLIRKLTINK